MARGREGVIEGQPIHDGMAPVDMLDDADAGKVGDDILPDEVVDRHVEGGRPKPDARKPAGRDAAPKSRAKDTADEDIEDDDDLDLEGALDEDEDTDDDEAGELDNERDEDDDDPDDEDDDDPDADEDDEDDDDDDDEDDDDDAKLEISPEERARIDKDPTLKKLHKVMERGLHKKFAEAKEIRLQAERRAAAIDQVEQEIRTPEGMVKQLTTAFREHPDVIGAAFEAIATDEGADVYLLEIGLAKPEAFRKAFERLEELESDPDAKARHIEKRDTESDKAKVANERKKLATERFDREVGDISGIAIRVAKKLGIDKDDYGDVRAALVARVREATDTKTGAIKLDETDVRRVVRQVKKEIDARYEKAEAKLERRRAKEKRDTVKQRLAKNKGRRGAPRSAGSPSPRRKAKEVKVADGQDGLDAFFAQRFDT